MTPLCPKCGLAHVGPSPRPERPCHLDELLEALGDVEPTEDQRRALAWLAGCERSTVKAIVALFTVLRARADTEK